MKMMYSFLLIFLAITGEVVGQQLDDTSDKKPIPKVKVDYGSDDTGGIIIIAAYRRRGGINGKYKKYSNVTKDDNKKSVKVMKDDNKELPKMEKDDRREPLPRLPPLPVVNRRVTRRPKSKTVVNKKPKVIIEDPEEYSLRRARYLFSQRVGK